MMNELCCIKQPETALVPHLKELSRALNNSSPSQLKTAFKRMCLDLYQAEQMPAGGNASLAYASVNRHVERIKNATEKILRTNMSQKSDLTEVLQSVMDSLKNWIQQLANIKKMKRLSNFSMWLASFQACKSTSEVEIPGQYTGDRLPNVKHHVKFSTFDPDVRVLVSKQKPICFSCVGNNGRNYEYIMKAGEDLRQDERIQLLFGIMNNIFDEDQICKERQLNIKTYRVFEIKICV
jgi:phosphatidylinositol kinase/protein kinase (PI-3  family)